MTNDKAMRGTWGYALILFFENSGKGYIKKCQKQREVFCKKGVLRIFLKFTRKHLYQSLFFNEVGSRIVKSLAFCLSESKQINMSMYRVSHFHICSFHKLFLSYMSKAYKNNQTEGKPKNKNILRTKYKVS